MKFVRSKGKDEAVTPAAPAAPRPPKPPKAAKKSKGARTRNPNANDKASKGGGRGKFVLFLGDEGAILVYMRGATVIRRLFAASPQPDHSAAILELMGSNPKVPLYVLADVLDQQYVRHSFPPVSSLSVNNLVKRRIDRDFQTEDLTGSIRLGREKTGRKEWQYLLIGLASTPLLQQWLDLLVEQPNELKGIFLPPVEAQRYIAKLHSSLTKDKPLPWQLLVSHHKVSGFRQVVLQDGKLVFTRVTQAIDDAVPAVIAGNIEQEIMNTLEYLRRLGFTDNLSLEIIVVTSSDVSETLDIDRFKVGQQFVLSPLDVADALSLNQAALSADRFGDVVMAASFARINKPVLKLMTAYGKKLAQIYQARLGVKVLGALGALALMGMAGQNFMGTMGNNTAAQDVETQRAPVQREMQTVRHALDGLNKDISFKSAIMLTYDAYMKDIHSPSQFIDKVAPFLSSEIRVRKFVWGPVGGVTTGTITAPGAPPTPTPPPAPGTPEAAGAATGPTQVALDIEVGGSFSNMEGLSTYVENFYKTLTAGMPDYTITHTPFAWEGQAETNLEISFNEQQSQGEAITESSRKFTLTFIGPKAVTATPGAPGMPGAPPAPMPTGKGAMQ